MTMRRRGIIRVSIHPEDVIDRLRGEVQNSMVFDILNFFSSKTFVGFIRERSFDIWRKRFRRSTACDRLVGEVRRARYGSIIEYQVNPPPFWLWSSGDEGALVDLIEGLFEDVRIEDAHTIQE